MAREIVSKSPPALPPPFKRETAKIPAVIPLKSMSGRRSYTLRPAKKYHMPQSTASTTPAAVSEHTAPPTIDDASASSGNEDLFVVTPPSQKRSTGPGLNGNQGDDGIRQSTVLPISGPKNNEMDSEGGRLISKCADEALHQTSAASRVEDMESLFGQVTPEQQEYHLERQSSTASRRTDQETDPEEPSSSGQIPQASQSSLSPTSSLSSRISKRSSQSSKGRRQKGLGQTSPSPKLERLAYSSTAVYKRPSEQNLSPLATPPPGRSQRSKRPSSQVLEPTLGSMDRSSPFEGLSQHSTHSASSNRRVVSRVNKQASSAGNRSLRTYRRDPRRFAIERRLKLVPEAHVSKYNPEAQRFSVAKENTEMLLRKSMNYAYFCLKSVEPNLPDVTLDGLEAIVNDLVHTINHRDASRRITIRGGRLKGQLIDRTLAETLNGYTMSCEQDAEFDPIVQLPLWHET